MAGSLPPFFTAELATPPRPFAQTTSFPAVFVFLPGFPFASGTVWKIAQYGKCNAIYFLSLSVVSDTDSQRVIIHVKDVNDEPPYFINRPLPMQAVVQLNALPNTPVFTLQARDPDTDHNIHYFIVRDRSE